MGGGDTNERCVLVNAANARAELRIPVQFS